jgi:hypothetical protein
MRLLTPLARIGRPTIVVVQALNRFFERMGCVLPSVGNSTLQFKKLDAFVLERMVRSIPRKHDARNWCRGSADLIESPTPLRVSRVTGTIRYVSVRAAW